MTITRKIKIEKIWNFIFPPIHPIPELFVDLNTFEKKKNWNVDLSRNRLASTAYFAKPGFSVLVELFYSNSPTPVLWICERLNHIIYSINWNVFHFFQPKGCGLCKQFWEYVFESQDIFTHLSRNCMRYYMLFSEQNDYRRLSVFKTMDLVLGNLDLITNSGRNSFCWNTILTSFYKFFFPATIYHMFSHS